MRYLGTPPIPPLSPLSAALAHTDAASSTTASHGNALTFSSAEYTTAFVNTRCESILAWPMFQDVVDPTDMAVESFAIEYGRLSGFDLSSSSGSVTMPQASRHGVQEHLFLPLCRKFLDLVHIRNPILDEAEPMRYAKRDVEHGIQWDGPSCLVLTACALASYTTPWHWTENGIAEGEEDASIADAFYMAAKKRHGLLGWNLIDIQCLFFASVHEKIALRPLQAWSCIQQASLRLQAQLKRRNRVQVLSETTEGVIDHGHLMQRVFWSVYKAEQELLPELPFRSSSIEDFTRADSMFPSPPPVEPTVEDTSSDQHLVRSQEQSWAFYLAEISIRRTMSDTIVTLYRKGEHY
ncbi:hypothetical protein DE146DRAFT_204002 [Phaeosphaeria sp. MPI-PUGE-AT-0046c]|nr:hypothetical protein DE146DRAFT_204002 [Phaeosphaeria sp. MPI-PUGE-AT-0046c]